MSSMGTQTRKGSTSPQGAVGASNEVYDLVSILYHALESSATNQQYRRDAQQAGDNDLLQFFQ